VHFWRQRTLLVLGKSNQNQMKDSLIKVWQNANHQYIHAKVIYTEANLEAVFIEYAIQLTVSKH